MFDVKYNKKHTMNKKKLREFYDFAKLVCIEHGYLFDEFFADIHPKYEKMQYLILK